MGGLKGQAGVVAIPLILLAISVLIVSSDITFFWEEGTVKEANIQATMYTMWNALQAAELYEDISIDYSVYQACYDLLRWGGFTEENKNWSNFFNGKEHENPPDEEQFKKNLFQLVQEYINRYTGKPYYFVEGYNVTSSGSYSIPDIKFISFNVEVLYISLSAASKDSLYIKNELNKFKEEIVLRKDFQTTKRYDMWCLGLFSWGKRDHEEIKPILRDNVTKEMEFWPTRNEKTFDEPCSETEKRLSDIENQLFHEKTWQFFIDPNAGLGEYLRERLKEISNWQGSIERAENRIMQNIQKSVSNSLSLLNYDGLVYTLTPNFEFDVKIDPDCRGDKIERDTKCEYTCNFNYNVNVTLNTHLMKKEPEYYPVASNKYPIMDTMYLVMSDRVAYKK